MNFGKRLLRVIGELNITQSELARRLGVKAQSVNGWCHSDILPRSEILDLLPAATGKPLFWFFMNDNDAQIPSSDPGDEVAPQPKTDLEKKLLERFEQLPTDEEKERIIFMIDERLKELDELVAYYLKKRNNKKTD